jgi:hypothetical protein
MQPGKRAPSVMRKNSMEWVRQGEASNATILYDVILTNSLYACPFSPSATKCGDCVAKCVQDETCKACLDKLTEMDTRDQALSYRTIVSYESDLLKDFSFCILQKNNIFGCSAEIPEIPKVEPLATWRGEPLTAATARDLLIAHLDDDKSPEVNLFQLPSYFVCFLCHV